MPIHRSSDDPALFPIENPNPVFRAAADGLILFANRASDSLLTSWGTGPGLPLPDEWRKRIADALASGDGQRVAVPCGGRVFELDLVPIPTRTYVNVYGRDVTEQEAARREREALFEQARDLIRYAPTGIYEVDFRTGRFRSVNDAMCAILGYSRDELMVMTAFDLLDDAGKVLFADRIRRTLAGEQVDQSVEYRVRKKDQSLIYAVLSVRITYHDGQPDGAFVIAHDITERRRAAEELTVQREELQAANSELEALAERLADQERFLASILESVPAQITYLDENLIYRQCNQAAADEFGAPLDRILGTHVRDMTPGNPQLWAAVESVLRTGQPFRSEELPVRWPDRPELGTQYYTVAYLPDKDSSGRVRGVFAEGQRVTALVEARQALQEARDELEERVQERTAELRASREQLKHLSHRLVERQESERSLVANELYNDQGQRLAALLLGLGQLEKEANGNRALDDYIARMKQLADGILSDMHSLAMNLRPASLDRLGLAAGLRHYADQLRQRDGREIYIDVSGSMPLSLPPDTETMLYRIAQEAVSNAILHAQASQIGIVATVREDRMVLVIEDNGQGFDVEEAVRCGGVGIVGMRERTEMLGGKLTIEAAPGKGTAVYIEVPLSISAA